MAWVPLTTLGSAYLSYRLASSGTRGRLLKTFCLSRTVFFKCLTVSAKSSGPPIPSDVLPFDLTHGPYQLCPRQHRGAWKRMMELGRERSENGDFKNM